LVLAARGRAVVESGDKAEFVELRKAYAPPNLKSMQLPAYPVDLIWPLSSLFSAFIYRGGNGTAT